MGRVDFRNDPDNLFSEKKQRYAYSQRFIQEMLDSVDIVEVLETEFDLFLESADNGWYNTNCPLPGHDDTSPSFGVNPEKGVFHCFGCNAGGNLLTFVRKMEGLTFRQAIERLMLITGMTDDGEESDTYRTLRDIDWTANEFLNFQAETQLPGGMPAVQFMRSLADRLRDLELKVHYDEEVVNWIDTVYASADEFVMKNDEKALSKLWKEIGIEMRDRLKLYRERAEEDNE